MSRKSKSCGVDATMSVRAVGTPLRNVAVTLLLAATATVAAAAAAPSQVGQGDKGCGINRPDGPMCRLF